MHRTIETSVNSELTDDILSKLKTIEHVVGLIVFRNSALIPKGDTILIHVLNKGADQVMSVIAEHSRNSKYSVVTSEVASISDPDHQKKIDHDVDEAIWEEMETGLRHNGRITANYLTLMALGGVAAAIGLVSETDLSVTALIAASIIAPGLEPVAKIPLGIVLGNKEVLITGLKATVVGYLLLILLACVSYWSMSFFGTVEFSDFAKNKTVESLLKHEFKGYLLSTVAAAASIIMYLSYRRNVIAGPLIVLVLIPSAGAAGISIGCGEWDLAAKFIMKLSVDIALIILLGILLIYLKQKFVHKRKPLS